MKKCHKCNEDKPLTEYYRASKRADGRQGTCIPCGKAYQVANRAKYGITNKAYREANKDKIKEYHKEYREENKVKLAEDMMWRNAKKRAEERGLPFNLPRSLVIPDKCPILGIPLFSGDGHIGDNSPTLDKLQPDLGYVVGNVSIMSSLANRIKTNANSEQIFKVAEWLKQKENEYALIVNRDERKNS